MKIDDLIEILELTKKVSKHEYIWDIEEFSITDGFKIQTCKGYGQYTRGCIESKGKTKTIEVGLEVEDDKLIDRSIEDVTMWQ